ncbi:uncharacterized protein LOC115964342 [Quercus lobata]|uniref:uncharacterized protein LOC115964342 n=1 Tax=Quercus lobata TaxID=97700 RepID=UPI0012486D1B|nr:uncharacterized protein LOC115964342 [Quercus lobata]
MGWKKLNTDGSVLGRLGQAGCGGVVRDDNGSWIAELDAKAVVDVLRNYNYDNTIISPIMDDCRKLLSCFQQIQIKHCYRQANRCADLLAKMGVEQEIDFLIFLNPPVDVLQILQDDRIGLYVNWTCHGPVASL